MAKICDRSPCDPLIKALGIWLFGTDEGFEMMVAVADEAEQLTMVRSNIDYCPFCGTRLEEVGPMMVEKYMRPRKRRRVSKMAAS